MNENEPQAYIGPELCYIKPADGMHVQLEKGERRGQPGIALSFVSDDGVGVALTLTTAEAVFLEAAIRRMCR